MAELFGGLLSFENQKDLDEFVENFDKESSIKIIEVALNYVQGNGGFNIEESYTLYKCIAKLKEKT